MNQPDPTSAAFMRSAATSLAGFASSELLQSQPDLRDSLAANAFTTWIAVLRNCVDELAAAVAMGRSQFFVDHVGWLQRLLTARGVPTGALPSAVACLARVLAVELPPEAGTRAAAMCQETLDALSQPVPEQPSFLHADTQHGRLAAAYLLALLEGDRARASAMILEAVDDGAEVADLYLGVLLPAQQEVGRMWHANEINVAEEHFATCTTKMILEQLRLRAPALKRNGKKLLAAAVKGNQHDIGLQVVADFFEISGWQVIQLGSDMPIPDLAQAVEFYQPDLVALSVALHTQLLTLSESIKAVRRGPRGAAVKILVGGWALAEDVELAQQSGADAYAADATAAVAVGNALVGLAS